MCARRARFESDLVRRVTAFTGTPLVGGDTQAESPFTWRGGTGGSRRYGDEHATGVLVLGGGPVEAIG